MYVVLARKLHINYRYRVLQLVQNVKKRDIAIESMRRRHALRVQEFVQLCARRVVDLDEPAPFVRLLRPQEVKRLLDGGLLLFGASVAPVVGDDRDDS